MTNPDGTTYCRECRDRKYPGHCWCYRLVGTGVPIDRYPTTRAQENVHAAVPSLGIIGSHTSLANWNTIGYDPRGPGIGVARKDCAGCGGTGKCPCTRQHDDEKPE